VCSVAIDKNEAIMGWGQLLLLGNCVVVAAVCLVYVPITRKNCAVVRCLSKFHQECCRKSYVQSNVVVATAIGIVAQTLTNSVQNAAAVVCNVAHVYSQVCSKQMCYMLLDV
jgi:hypothetical protein